MTEQTQEPLSLEVAPPPETITFDTPAIDLANPSQPSADVPTIDLTDANNPPQLTATGIEQKAKTLHYALQEKSPGVTELQRHIQQNKERDIRTGMAFAESYKQQKIATGIIGELVKSRGNEPLTPDEEKGVYELAKNAGSVDPETIVEKMWASNYVKELMHTPAQLMMAGLADAPVATMGTAGTAVKAVGTQQVALALKQKMDKKWEDTPILGPVEDSVDKITAWVRPWVLPASDNYLLHNAAEGSSEFTRGLGKIIPGDNLQQQKDYLYLLGPEKAKPIMEAAVDYLWKHSPMAAFKFIEAMIDYPSDAAAVDNLLGVVEVATSIPGVKLARGAKAAKSAERSVLETMNGSVPVKVSTQFVAANEHILFSPEQIKQMEEATKKLVNADRLEKRLNRPAVNYTSRPMAPYELEKAAGAFPEDAPYPPSRDFYSHSAGSVGAPRGIVEDATPRGMSPREIQAAKDGTPGYSLSRQFSPEAYKEATTKLRGLQSNLDESNKTLDELIGKGNKDDIAFQQAKITKMEKEYEEAVKARDTIAIYNVHPTIARAQQGMKSYMSSGVRALQTAPTGTGLEKVADLQSTLTTLGRAEEAIQTGAVRRSWHALNPSNDPAEVANSVGKDLPSTHRPNPDIVNPSALSREGSFRYSDEMTLKLQEQQNKLNEAAGGQRVQRITEQDAAVVFNQTKATVPGKYQGDFHNAVLDQKTEKIYNPQQNVSYVKTWVGKTDGTGFADEFSARNTMSMQYKIPLKDFAVVQEGNSFYGIVLTPVNESGALKTTTIPTNNLTPSFWGESFTGLRKLRSAADTTSPLQMQARHTATHAPQRINKVIEDIASSVKLTPEDDIRLTAMLKQSELDFDAAGNKGNWWGLSKLEQEYGTRYGSLPSEEFVKGYYTYKQLMDFDYALRSNYVYSYWTRWGAENFTFKIGDNASPSFMGRVVEDIDKSKVRDRGLLFIDEKGTPSYKWSREDYENNKDGFAEMVKKLQSEQGYQIIQLAQPFKKPLKDIDGREVYYVISKNIERNNLSPHEMLPYRGGPHVAYTHPHFVGQMLLTRDGKGQVVYAGDKIFRNGGSSSAEARAWAIKYDTARQLMNSGDDAALNAYVRNNLPEDIDSFKKLFTGPDALDRDLPIAYHSHGRNILQENDGLYQGGYNGVNYDYHKFKDYFDDFSNPEGGLNAGFLQERSNRPLMVPKDLGNVGPSRFQLETAATLDPYIALRRGLQQANRVHFMEDYKILAAESFVKEFGKFIRGATDEALQRNPVHWLYDGVIDAPHNIKGRMEAYRENVKNFIGMQSDLGMDITNLEAKLQDSMYRGISVKVPFTDIKVKTPGLGSETTAKFFEKTWVQESLIPFIKDPASYARAAAFKTRLGVFNPVQYWQQGQNVAAIVAISPRAGLEGAKIASYLQAGGRYALDDPAKFDHYAGMIAKSSNWTIAEAKEALKAYKDSGIGIVGSESASKTNTFAAPKIYQSKWLDKGDMFFNHGEGFSRDTAYFTSYREWKVANPGQIPNQYDLGEILRRTNDLTFSMTRASNSAFQSNSFLSIPLQFQTFRIRQMELMLGAVGGEGRITRAELGRMQGTYMTLYGIPTGLSAGAGIYNFYDDIRTYAIEKGYNLDNAYFKGMHEGILALTAYALTGKNLNVASAWGPGASNIANDIIDSARGVEGSKTWWELATGPVGSLAKNATYALDPLAKWGIAKISGEEYPLQVEDFLRFAELTATSSNAKKAWEAYNLQKEFTKTGALVGSATTWDGILKFGFGLSNREYQDAFLLLKNRKEITGFQETAKKEIRTMYDRAKKALAEGEFGRAEELEKQARRLQKLNDIPAPEMTQIWMQSGNQSLNDRAKNNLNDPRASKRQEHIDNLRKPQ